jgi:hypothetical protein
LVTTPCNPISKACGNWNPKNKIGEGGYGTVFKGEWRYQEVAIKKIRKKEGASEEDLNKAIEQIFKEIRTLSSFRYICLDPTTMPSPHAANFPGRSISSPSWPLARPLSVVYPSLPWSTSGCRMALWKKDLRRKTVVRLSHGDRGG